MLAEPQRVKQDAATLLPYCGIYVISCDYPICGAFSGAQIPSQTPLNTRISPASGAPATAPTSKSSSTAALPKRLRLKKHGHGEAFGEASVYP
jgi:hypothetical protein